MTSPEIPAFISEDQSLFTSRHTIKMSNCICFYNDELEARESKKPSDTSVFGTNILLTLGVTIVGKGYFEMVQTLQNPR